MVVPGIANNDTSSRVKGMTAMNRIRALRHQRGLTQVELARAAKCAQSSLSEIETGQANPTQGMLEAIALALHVSVSQLFVDDPSGPDGLSISDDVPLPRSIKRIPCSTVR